MNTILENILTAQQKSFKTWEDADRHCVSNIFRFSEQCGNLSTAEAIATVLDTDVLIKNKFLSKMTFRVDNDIDFLKSVIDQYLESNLNNIEPHILDSFEDSKSLTEAHQAMFLFMAYTAIKLFDELKNDERYNSFINVFLSEVMIATTVAKKQRDYGPNNIAKFGVSGLVVRIHDKIARLENLLSSKRSGINSVQNETIFDTLLDIVGYSTVALLWVNGWFYIPMDGDKE